MKKGFFELGIIFGILILGFLRFSASDSGSVIPIVLFAATCAFVLTMVVDYAANDLESSRRLFVGRLKRGRGLFGSAGSFPVIPALLWYVGVLNYWMATSMSLKESKAMLARQFPWVSQHLGGFYVFLFLAPAAGASLYLFARAAVDAVEGVKTSMWASYGRAVMALTLSFGILWYFGGPMAEAHTGGLIVPTVNSYFGIVAVYLLLVVLEVVGLLRQWRQKNYDVESQVEPLASIVSPETKAPSFSRSRVTK